MGSNIPTGSHRIHTSPFVEKQTALPVSHAKHTPPLLGTALQMSEVKQILANSKKSVEETEKGLKKIIAELKHGSTPSQNHKLIDRINAAAVALQDVQHKIAALPAEASHIQKRKQTLDTRIEEDLHQCLETLEITQGQEALQQLYTAYSEADSLALKRLLTRAHVGQLEHELEELKEEYTHISSGDDNEQQVIQQIAAKEQACKTVKREISQEIGQEIDIVRQLSKQSTNGDHHLHEAMHKLVKTQLEKGKIICSYAELTLVKKALSKAKAVYTKALHTEGRGAQHKRQLQQISTSLDRLNSALKEVERQRSNLMHAKIKHFFAPVGKLFKSLRTVLPNVSRIKASWNQGIDKLTHLFKSTGTNKNSSKTKNVNKK